MRVGCGWEGRMTLVALALGAEDGYEKGLCKA